MLKPIEKETRWDAGFRSPFHSGKTANESTPNMSNVIPFRCTRSFPRSQGSDQDRNLSELEAENAQLRTSAIQLVLEIQKLRERRCR
jgi:hypothetical protein